VIKKNFSQYYAQSPNEIFYGTDMQRLRDDFRNGRRPSECEVCWVNESKSVTSMRNHGISKFKDLLDQERLDDPTLSNLIIMGNNVCNFNCRICEPNKSSKIAMEELRHTSDEIKIKEIKFHLDESNYSYQYDQVLESLSDLEQLHILGGEPLLWKRFPELLKDIIARDRAKSIRLEINTNSSIDPTFIIPYLSEFKYVEILLSIDDIGNRFEIQRGGKWATVLKNIETFKSIESTNISVKLTPTVNIQNLLYLDELVSFANSMNLSIIWTYLEVPSEFNIDRITYETKKLVWEKYNSHSDPELRAIANRVTQTKPVTDRRFLDAVEKFDSRRKQDFSLHHPELVKAMSGHKEN
jgi:sulfatase maturation enzyme AslB (radical SAM superfamily)